MHQRVGTDSLPRRWKHRQRAPRQQRDHGEHGRVEYSCWRAGCSRIEAAYTRGEQLSSLIGRDGQHSSRTHTSVCTGSLAERMEAHKAASVSAGTQSRRAWEGTAPGRPAVAATWPPPRVLTSLAARSVAFGTPCHVYPHCTHHTSLLVCTRRWKHAWNAPRVQRIHRVHGTLQSHVHKYKYKHPSVSPHSTSVPCASHRRGPPCIPESGGSYKEDLWLG